MKEAIGGYFELELRQGSHYHANAIRLNSGRNCFEYILRARGYSKVYMPYYTCQVMLDTMQDLGIEIAYYTINEQLEPTELPILQKREAFLYTNYYGLKQASVKALAKHYGNQLIVDNAQAFYAERMTGIDTFYSPRKFFGVPDGGYLYTDALLETDFPQAESLERMISLLKRIEQGAEAGYQDFQAARVSIDHRPIERMSKITEAILGAIDYEEIAQKRKHNYQVLHECVKNSNLFYVPIEEDAVPMVYPYMIGDGDLRKRLIENKVFVATYWPNVDESNECEKMLKNNLIPLPIDQRYTDMVEIVQRMK